MKLTVVGAGYVGLTAAACLATVEDIHVTCLEIDRARTQQLQAGECPIREPELGPLIQKGLASGKLLFTDRTSDAVCGSDIFLLAVGTPAMEDGTPNMSALYQAADSIAQYLTQNAIVLIKSTIPPGGTELVQKRFNVTLAQKESHIDVVYCPEFLREGSSVADFMSPQRIIIGSNDPLSIQRIVAIYQRCCGMSTPILTTTPQNAELIKYASNSFLALKVAFADELARLCMKVGGNIGIVTQGMGMDFRIGPEYLQAGIGYGGACLPKDIQGLTISAREANCPLPILEQVILSNKAHQNWLCSVVCEHTPDKAVIGVWGLTFKANTNDLRDSPAISFIKQLANNGSDYKFQIYDPTIYVEKINQLNGIQHICVKRPEHAIINADILLILVPWGELKEIKLGDFETSMHRKTVFDLCRLYAETSEFIPQEFTYWCLGSGE